MNSDRRINLPSGLTGYLICLAGFLLAVVAFYPGYLSPDSIAQLAQGRNWDFDDWHPPVMAAVWGMVDKIIPGPFGMLLLHNALFWGGAAVFWRATKRKSVWLGLTLALFGFMPQTLALLSTIWKDVGLGVSLLMAAALLYTATQENSRAALIAACPLLFYGYAVRLNAAPAILPLALWSGFIACRMFPALKTKTGKFRVLPFALGLVYFGLLTLAVTTATDMLVKGKHSYTVQTVWLHDLSAISTARGEALFPDYVVRDENFALEKVTAHYEPHISTAILPGGVSGLKLSNHTEDIAALRAKWLETVLDNKAVYLRHRWEVFKVVTGFNTPYVCFAYLFASYPNQFGYKVNDWQIHRLLRAYFFPFKDSLLFRGFFWLLISFALIYFSLRGKLRGDLELVFVLAASGFLYGVGYFFYAPACDFRFLWWTMIAASVALVFFAVWVAGEWRLRREAKKES